MEIFAYPPLFSIRILDFKGVSHPPDLNQSTCRGRVMSSSADTTNTNVEHVGGKESHVVDSKNAQNVAKLPDTQSSPSKQISAVADLTTSQPQTPLNSPPSASSNKSNSTPSTSDPAEPSANASQQSNALPSSSEASSSHVNNNNNMDASSTTNSTAYNYNGSNRKLCAFFATGTCRNGAQCRFRHEMPTTTNIGAIPINKMPPPPSSRCTYKCPTWSSHLQY